MTAEFSAMNVAALKRVDPYVKDILETASHVALYTFRAESDEWEKAEIEGALFVYSRNGEPCHSFLIMNRLSTNNQVEPVTSGLEIQCQEPFLLYRNGKGMIFGIWFYEKEECIKISNMLEKLAKDSNKDMNKSTPKIKKAMPKKSNNIDIFSMLSKAQEDYNSHKNNSKENVRGSDTKSPMSNAMGELSGALSAMAMAPDVTSKSVMDFFAKAKVNTGQYKSGDQVPVSNVVNEGKPLLARLMSNPAHSVEHIEKQQRSITPQPVVPTQVQPGIIPMTNQSCENSIISKLQKKVPPKSVANAPTGHPFAALNSSACSAASSIPLHIDESNNSTSFLRIQSPPANNLSNNAVNQHKNSSFYYNPPYFHQGSPPAADIMLIHNQHNSTACEDLIPPLTPKSNNESAPALIPPGMFAAPSPAVPEPLNRPVEPLTRNQLLQAFNYLVRTDTEFVNKLHEAYVKSFSERLS